MYWAMDKRRWQEAFHINTVNGCVNKAHWIQKVIIGVKLHFYIKRHMYSTYLLRKPSFHRTINNFCHYIKNIVQYVCKHIVLLGKSLFQSIIRSANISNDCRRKAVHQSNLLSMILIVFLYFYCFINKVTDLYFHLSLLFCTSVHQQIKIRSDFIH